MCVGEMEGWSQTAEGIFNKRKMLFQRETDQNEKKEIVNVEEWGGGHRILAPSLPVQALIIIDSFSGFSICHSVNEKKNSLLTR